MSITNLNLDIRGYLPTSLIDYPGYLAPVVFLSRCTFRCPFCHNPELIKGYENLEKIDLKNILLDLKLRKNWVEGIVFTGGEPTIYKDLPLALKKIKALGVKIKLDTNGSNPDMIKHLLGEKLVDYIAMDIKNSLEKYEETTRVKVDKEKIKKSIDLIKKSKIDYEFRTTIPPGLISDSEMEAVGKLINGAKKYVIQQFRPHKTLDRSFEKKEALSNDKLEKLAEIVRKYVKEVEIRGI